MCPKYIFDIIEYFQISLFEITRGNSMISSVFERPGRVAQSVGHLTRKSGVLGSIPGLATYFRFFFRFSRRAVVSYWRKYVHEVLVNRLGGLSLPRKSVVRLTDRPDMTLDVYRGRKTTKQQQQQPYLREHGTHDGKITKCLLLLFICNLNSDTQNCDNVF